ncbi:MAG: hypothetical protein APF77_01320 [Clostridia bacterium BRH_c25]|nr:MAG: hypothetical protein APF77_01320 [Clostridia bacterium BRH_c25]
MHIVNGCITNRHVGGSITNFALELLQKENYSSQEYITNYIGTVKGNEKILRSSTYIIKDDEGEILGLLCVNIDITDLLRIRNNIDNMIMIDELKRNTGNPKSREKFDVSVDDLVEEIINTVIIESGVKSADTSIEQKKELIQKMEAKGVFKFKGTLNTVAKLLNVSAQTIYRYLKEIEKPV